MSDAVNSGTAGNRREFLKTSTAAAAGAMALGQSLLAPGAYAAGSEEIKVGLIGCGGRGRGAAAQALKTEGPVKLVAMGDTFADRLEDGLREIQKAVPADRIDVPSERKFVGFDAYEKVLNAGVDLVILATPPHFRPQHFEAAVNAGKHVFFEKPVAVDGPGVRRVLAANEVAKSKNIAVVCGLQRHHQYGYIETIKRLHDGAIGDIVAAHCYWNMGSLWMHPRQEAWSDMEWQLRNWLYFTWLSGDHIVEQHVHNLDVINWIKKSHPVKCFGVGGRQVRTDPAYGHIFDHHAVHYEYGDGTKMFSMCFQIDGCRGDVSEHVIGTKGRADVSGYRITGDAKWRYDGRNNDPYQTEHDDLFASIRKGSPLNEGEFVAHSTLTAIMGRMATYSGKEITWEQALNSTVSLGPKAYEFGALPMPAVPTPGISAPV